jgi:hypothetical protein
MKCPGAAFMASDCPPPLFRYSGRLTTAALILFAPIVIAQPALVPRVVLDGRVTLLLPVDFAPMSQEMMKLKYPAERRPAVVYTNERGTVNIALSHTSDRMPPDEVPSFHKSLEATFKRLYPSAQWFQSDVVTMNERTWFLLELRTPAIDTDVRNIMMGTSVDGRLLLISFNVTSELEEEWLDTGRAVIRSVVVK